MFTRFAGYGLSCMMTVLLVTFPGGCSGEAALTGTTHGFARPVTDDAASHAELVAKLTKADQLDGKADKIVVRCASCALNMDGKPDHALKVLDYTLYFCKETCAQQFAKNLTKSVQEMKVPERAPAKEPTPKPEKREASVRDKMLAKLAKADRLDGKADKVVVRCASCALNMDGTSDHTVKALDYTLYFCKEACAKRFAKDITKSVLALNVPEDPPAPGSDDEEAKEKAYVHAKIMAKLAAADLLDGKADKTIVRCASCALSMDGIADRVRIDLTPITLLFGANGSPKHTRDGALLIIGVSQAVRDPGLLPQTTASMISQVGAGRPAHLENDATVCYRTHQCCSPRVPIQPLPVFSPGNHGNSDNATCIRTSGV